MPRLGLQSERTCPMPHAYNNNGDPLAELNRRLAVVRDRVRGVAYGHHNGFYLFGRPGTAKTHTVQRTLDEEDCTYFYHNGHLTPMGLFELLDEQHDRVIVLDDVSEIFGQRKALQILLAALGNQPDGSGARIIKYRRQGSEETIRFTGGIILISNLKLHASPLLEALKSRVHYLQYNPTDEHIAALMLDIASSGWKTLSPVECRQIADFLIAQPRELRVRLDLRLLVDKAFPDYLQWKNGKSETHWKDLVRTTLEEQLVPLEYTTQAHRTRRERKEEEHAIVRAIIDQHPTREEQVRAWREQTGKSQRAFYRRLAEMG